MLDAEEREGSSRGRLDILLEQLGADVVSETLEVEICGRRPGFRWDSPISGPRRRSRFRGSAFHRRCCLPAYQMWVLNLRRNALSGLQNGRRGPSRRFSGGKRGPGLPKTR